MKKFAKFIFYISWCNCSIIINLLKMKFDPTITTFKCNFLDF